MDGIEVEKDCEVITCGSRLSKSDGSVALFCGGSSNEDVGAVAAAAAAAAGVGVEVESEARGTEMVVESDAGSETCAVPGTEDGRLAGGPDAEAGVAFGERAGGGAESRLAIWYCSGMGLGAPERPGKAAGTVAGDSPSKVCI